MENMYLGLLRICVRRGLNLVVRDAHKASSDPYVVITLGKQKLKTHRVENSLNPEWNEELTLCIEDPCMPVKLEVYDYDTLTFDDNMGGAEIDIRPLIEVVKMELENFADGTIIKKIFPSRENYLAEESCVVFKDKKVVQDMRLRLKNIESGEIEIQLQWIDLPGSKGA
ncbi:hypothetical protein Syun_022060 [Stephania yunnanensis]|uniref:C2 domain-containing protein n=1 Tax=Stephania yunnanensis TaxID=152371 RepID=A0AAP0IHR8_9MAGN